MSTANFPADANAHLYLLTVLGLFLDTWYAGATYDHFGAVFTGAPATTTWTAAGMDWIEW